MSIVSSLNIAKEALAVNQAAITVVSNNIANVDTAGYSKLRVDQASVVSISSQSCNSAVIKAESLSGVQLKSVTRYSDAFLQSYYCDQNSTYSYYNEYASAASGIEDLVNEFNNTGLSKALDTFYSAVNSLNGDPSDTTARSNYVSSAQNLCSVFNNMSSNLSAIQVSLNGTSTDLSSSQIASEVDGVNSLLDQITEVNKSIIATNANGGASDPTLLDKRDSLVTSLSALTNVKTQENKNGTINVLLGDYTLVNGAHAEEYFKATNSSDVDGNVVTTISLVDANNQNITKVDNINGEITSGSIAAILDVCGTNTAKLNVHGVVKNLNAMANSFAEVMNNIQTTVNASGTPMCLNAAGTALQVSGATNYLFVNAGSPATPSVGITAGNITINQAIIDDPNLVAAARSTNPADPNVLKNIGNNSNVKEITAARTDSSYYVGTSLQNSTLEKYLAGTVSDVGSEVESLNSSAKTQAAVLKTVGVNLHSVTGVNLDEELADLIKYQRAYQAAARIFSTCNQLLEDLVNLGK